MMSAMSLHAPPPALQWSNYNRERGTERKKLALAPLNANIFVKDSTLALAAGSVSELPPILDGIKLCSQIVSHAFLFKHIIYR